MSSAVSPAPRTVLVTGATSGIGWETARLLAGRGDTVIVHAPDQASGDDAVTRLAAAGADPLCLRLVVADFSRLDEVRAMAARVAEEHPAGCASSPTSWSHRRPERRNAAASRYRKKKEGRHLMSKRARKKRARRKKANHGSRACA